MDPIETYFSELRAIHSTGAGTKETSYYPPLANLLNELGRKLSPKVRCVAQLANTGAGSPDYGLYTQDQFQRSGDEEPRPGQMPSRGAVELKGPAADLDAIIASKQVGDYLTHYGLLLVGNLREFRLLQRDPTGGVRTLEACTLAAHADGLWLLCAQPRKAAKMHGERFGEFLRRAMLYRVPLAAPKDLAWFLASYAREARVRIESADLDALAAIRAALEDALGIRFQDQRGEHFFRSTFVQTLFYGVFSAWVLWDRQTGRGDPAARFDWRFAAHYLHVPLLRALFHQMAAPGPLNSLRLTEVLELTQDALNRVDRPAFFAAFDEGEAVQYFYEPFLEAFDPQLRKDLGVWYTPREIVQYMVARVDAMLREELGIADGLAGDEVYILDPCCGTGAYLVEVIKTIARTMRERGADALWADDLKQAALKRVIGFEILTAPFVVAHLQLGLLLQHLGAPLAQGESERVGVYLTNALTGWEPPTGPKAKLPFPEFEAERDAADEVKRERPILVVLGNPPYNGFAGMAVEEERELTTAYRSTRQAPPPQGQGLNDLYVRFYRMAERRIVEMSGKGVVCFISNYSWLDGLSFTGMRERYLDAFDCIWVDCLNGDKYKTGKLTPKGAPDPSVFSTKANPEGIQVGTAIGLLVRKESHQPVGAVRFRHLWGKAKRAELLASAPQPPAAAYASVEPAMAMGLPLVPGAVASGYLSWPNLPELFPVSFPGVKTSRDEFLVDIDREELEKRLRPYFDPEVSDQAMALIAPRVMESSARYDAVKVRKTLQGKGENHGAVVRYCYRPFDLRWLYWEPDTKLLDEKRSEYMPHIFKYNRWLESRQHQPKEGFDRGYYLTQLGDNFGNGLSSFFPLLLREGGHGTLYAAAGTAETRANLSSPAAGYLESWRADPDSLFLHALAVLHAPEYRTENAGALRQDWPRIPLPDSKAQLLASADLGRRLAALLDPEQPVPGVTAHPYRPELAQLGEITRVGGGQIEREAGHLALTAGWGHAGKGGVTMPGSGRANERDYQPDELAAITAGAAALGLAQAQALDLLGATCLDVYLNGEAYWRCVPAKVWSYTIGGYQVLKKWLSYRERKLLDRDLSRDEARYFGEVARRIAAILLLGPELDANYQAVKARAYPWPGVGQAKA